MDKQMISFFVTTNCNLDCIYCYTNKKTDSHKGQTLEFEFAKTAIDDYFASSYAKHVRFQGAGEPTTNIVLVNKLLDYARSATTEEVTSEIQTNACFSPTVAEWVAENIDNIWASCDGLPSIQNHNRPFLGGGGSAKVFERNVRYLVANAKKMVGIRSTITRANMMLQKECIDYYHSLGVSYIWVDPVFPKVGELEAEDAMDLMTFATEFLDAVKHAESLGIEYGSMLTSSFDRRCDYACRACLPVPHVTTDGYISACDMALFGNDKDHMALFYYGRWNRETMTIEYDSHKIAHLRSRTVCNIPHCSKCIAKHNCCGYCPGEALNETHDYFGQKTRMCQAIRWLFVNMTEKQKQYSYTHP
jgi:uncharacterized protein